MTEQLVVAENKKFKRLSPSEREEIKQRHRVAVGSMGSLSLPPEVIQKIEAEGFKHRFCNNSREEATNLANYYSIGWINPPEHLASFIRARMGKGIFNQGSNGEGSTVEIPLGIDLTARLLVCPHELYEINNELREEVLKRTRDSLGQGPVFSGAKPDNLHTDTEIGVVR